MVDNDSEILHSEYFSLHKNDIRRNRNNSRGKSSTFKNETDFALTFFVPY